MQPASSKRRRRRKKPSHSWKLQLFPSGLCLGKEQLLGFSNEENKEMKEEEVMEEENDVDALKGGS